MKKGIKIKMIPSEKMQEFTISFTELGYTKAKFIQLSKEKQESIIQEYTDTFSESNPIFYVPQSIEIL